MEQSFCLTGVCIIERSGAKVHLQLNPLSFVSNDLVSAVASDLSLGQRKCRIMRINTEYVCCAAVQSQ